MENQNNRFLSVSYSLYVNGEKGKELTEKTTAGKPFQFISGFGIALDAFEQQLIGLEPGATFDFELSKEQAYGEYFPERVLDLDREIFSINGKFDGEHIYPEAIIPLQNEEGSRFYGRVVEVGQEKVKVDLNHPLAGETLYFKGEVLENREATDEEIKHLMKQLTGGCGCNCDDCGGGCGGGCGDGQGDCGCGDSKSGCGCNS
jgi:FKBP-type peptidyl-prolyl cis-trans isomerase SlyD